MKTIFFAFLFSFATVAHADQTNHLFLGGDQLAKILTASTYRANCEAKIGQGAVINSIKRDLSRGISDAFDRGGSLISKFKISFGLGDQDVYCKVSVHFDPNGNQSVVVDHVKTWNFQAQPAID